MKHFKLPDVTFTEWQAAQCSESSYCHAYLRLDSMPEFLYTRIDIGPGTVTTSAIQYLTNKARRDILRKARAIKDELNEIDLGVEIRVDGAGAK